MLFRLSSRFILHHHFSSFFIISRQKLKAFVWSIFCKLIFTSFPDLISLNLFKAKLIIDPIIKVAMRPIGPYQKADIE
ncbi:hypothetical protein BpHYR1_045464 [Brachionus plicatilis]|uniref:Uncharacterized protein n=1 Tax=Brachionus plicatilis TaxID=10195 RepID=A0A3M7T4D2_BRAPC|nr:hypothetical protein BpHYR1_045464 [Brachionus plicatilis]